MVAFTIAAFLTGMLLLAFLAVVSEKTWVVATVGGIHLVGSVVLGVLVVRQLGAEERDADD